MRTKIACVFIGFGVLLMVTPVSTHHAFSAEFDIDKPLNLTGKLVKWEMINPHSWFHIDIEGDDGTTVTWQIEGGSPNELIRNGVTKNTLDIGIELTIEGYHAKDGTPKGVGRNFLLADGERLFLGGSAPPAVPAAR
ncbi:MAG: hypothetical protein CL484_14830 [Acidobacteria bacterium]|nr:hypothetical protein [Acidobacteriota bacterium]|tara:strand:- start:420 stop:830 length:411 start_codon:yes stop_codon:yes gene_type:complete